jgi:NAD(P)-dependent dehydrogenase (short-subunit alcohol dehydrogenase family)
MADEARKAAITGAFGALGSVVARTAAARGWRVALIDSAPAAADLAKGGLVLAGVDLTDAAHAQQAMAAARDGLGGLDALINIAGGFRWTTLEDSDPAVWELLFRINVLTAANAARAALPALKASGRGRIVNVGAGAAEHAAAGMGPYAASKAGVCKLTESLAAELKDAGVTVNAVLPSIIDTPANRADMPKADFTRWVSPAELAEVMLFLASDAAAAVTGALVRVPGRV